ncbi:hypothetical protein HU749_020955 [Pseudomonas ogarae]|uniref:hypothetical protein n=1 Tax=Pseudomonas ogarae (strain DSM 112162 / CECT 30235 / F113) TaxID=1114970 RepID=UPI0016491D69|nr:hypothetical protein [Pseudomonas zarinae]QXH93301.1 hypothetical protein HU749_020955 [Pseudomonas zarinae]
MTSIEKDLADIRKLTRISLPESDRYVYRLGVVVYAFASVSSFMAEVICYMNPQQPRSDLEAKMGGLLADAFKQAVAKIEHSTPEAFAAGQVAGELFTTLNDERSDIIHSYPITSPTGIQILHRRQNPVQPKNKGKSKGEAMTTDKPPKYFEVTDEFLDNFITRLHQVNDCLYRIRSILRPDI